MIIAWSFRLGRDVALLDDETWSKIAPDMGALKQSMKHVIQTSNTSLSDARRRAPVAAQTLENDHALTGYRLYDAFEIYAVRQSDDGRLCPNCTKPFRTPRAKLCAECGFELPQGQVAGPLSAS